MIALALAQGVALEIIDGVYAQLLAGLEDGLAHQRRGLHVAVAAEGAGGQVVRHDDLRVVLLVVGLAEYGQGVRADGQHELLGRGADAGVGDLLHLHRARKAVLLHAELDVRPRDHAVLVHAEVLLLGVGEEHGAVRGLRHHSREHQALDVAAVELGAEAAAHGGRDQPHLLVGHVQGRSHVLMAVGRSRGGGDEIVGAVLVAADDGGRLHGQRVLAVAYLRVHLDDDVGLGEALLKVAGLEVEVVLVRGDVAGQLGIELRGVGREGLVYREDGL